MTTPILRKVDVGCAILIFGQQSGNDPTSHMIYGSFWVTTVIFYANRNLILPNYELVLEDEVAETVEFEPLPDPPPLPPLLPFFF